MAIKTVYAQNQKQALINFRRLTPNKYVPIKAKYSGKKHNTKVYLIWYRLRKGEY